MIAALSPRRIFVLAIVVALAIVGGYLLLRPSEQPPITGGQGPGPPPVSQKEPHRLEPESDLAAEAQESKHAPVTPSNDPLDLSSDPMFAELLEQTGTQIVKESQEQFQGPQDKMEMTKAAFEKALAGADKDTKALRRLIEKGDQQQKEWLKEALIGRIESDPDPRARRLCLIHIVMFRDIAPEILEGVLTSDPDRLLRFLAACALAHVGTEAEVDALAQAIRDDKGVPGGHGPDIAGAAIGALGDIGGQKAADALWEVWKTEQARAAHREETVSALGMVGDPAGFEVLLSVLKGDNELLRDNAIFGLGRLAMRNPEESELMDRTAALLRQYLNDGNPRVRIQAALGLGFIGGRQDIPLLGGLLYDEHTSIRGYTEDGQQKEKTAYPVREAAQHAIDRINARLALQE